MLSLKLMLLTLSVFVPTSIHNALLNLFCVDLVVFHHCQNMDILSQNSVDKEKVGM